MFDVVVVGAGPAGATLARLLAQRGASVALLERCRLPRYKACGGGLTPRALSLVPEEARAAVRLVSTRAEVHYGGYRLQLRARGRCVALVQRAQFDQALVRLAAAAGAEVREGAPVTAARALADRVEVTAGGTVLSAAYLACADGSTGPFAGPLGAAVGLAGTPPRIGALEVEVADAEGRWGDCLRADLDVLQGGYAWVFPKDGSLSVGVASWRPGHGGRVLRAALDRYLVRLGLAGRPVLAAAGHPIPVGGTAVALAGPRARRLGDAAALVDPFLGEGIAHALASAHLAAPALLAGALPAYAAAVTARFHRRWRPVGRLGQLFYAAPGLWCALAAALPNLGDHLYTRALGESPHGLAL